ncbi:UNVERIFIED_CONTAM: Subtilisin-like protease SBT2.4, partial [Sesamum radiatum]
NSGVPVVVNGFFYGRASGMAPRARIAMYKAIYPTVGSLADVLAAIDQAVLDGVDILTLSIGPDEPPEDTVTFLSAFEIFMLSAHKAGVFVAQAVGNQGPGPYTVVSYSPWTVGVAPVAQTELIPALCPWRRSTYWWRWTVRSQFWERIAQYKLIISQYYEEQTYRDEEGLVIRYSGRAAIGEGRIATYTERAPTVSRFSSRGPDYVDQNKNPADVLKPDILAPGHQIWAAWSPMSVDNPILSGIAALIKQINPSWSPSMMASAMSTTATKYDNRGEPIMAEGFGAYIVPSRPIWFGAGLVDPIRALDPGLVFSTGN